MNKYTIFALVAILLFLQASNREMDQIFTYNNIISTMSIIAFFMGFDFLLMAPIEDIRYKYIRIIESLVYPGIGYIAYLVPSLTEYMNICGLICGLGLTWMTILSSFARWGKTTYHKFFFANMMIYAVIGIYLQSLMIFLVSIIYFVAYCIFMQGYYQGMTISILFQFGPSLFLFDPYTFDKYVVPIFFLLLLYGFGKDLIH